jgi:hypothetical protein
LGADQSANGEDSALHLFCAPQYPALIADHTSPTPVLHTAATLPYQQVMPSPKDESADDAKQIQYTINIIEDCRGCLQEYEALRKGAPMMFAESKTLLPAIRMLEKNHLIRQLSTPKLMCTEGQSAELEIASEAETERFSNWTGVRLEVGSERFEDGLKVELAMHASEDERRFRVRTAVVVDEGQTIVMNANAGPVRRDDTQQERPAVYIVLTPEVLK